MNIFKSEIMFTLSSNGKKRHEQVDRLLYYDNLVDTLFQSIKDQSFSILTTLNQSFYYLKFCFSFDCEFKK